MSEERTTGPKIELHSWRIVERDLGGVWGGGRITRRVIQAEYTVDGQKWSQDSLTTSLGHQATKEQVVQELRNHHAY